MANTILSGYGGILSSGSSLLENGRRAFAGNGIGMSASSRSQLEGFYNGATALFNQLYTAAENGEVSNNITILALRSKHSYNVAEGVFDDGSAAASTTSGTQVDTEA